MVSVQNGVELMRQSIIRKLNYVFRAVDPICARNAAAMLENRQFKYFMHVACPTDEYGMQRETLNLEQRAIISAPTEFCGLAVPNPMHEVGPVFAGELWGALGGVPGAGSSFLWPARGKLGRAPPST